MGALYPGVAYLDNAFCLRRRCEGIWRSFNPSSLCEKTSRAWENKPVLVSIEVPDQILFALENRAREVHSTIQDVALEAIRKDVEGLTREHGASSRVRLPLVRSAEPGALRSLTNAEIDDLLGS